MKRPLSPSNLPGSSIRGGFQESPGVGSPAEQRLKKEKKHPSFTLCEVCNIQLNSAVQAQIHYNGKSHQKRLKQLSKSKVLPSQGPAGHHNSLLTSLPLPGGRSLHPPLDIKHFLTFRLNGTTPLNLFPNFSTMDPVQKAVIKHTFGVANPLKKKQFISCNICHLRFNSANQAEAHYRGHKHARRLKAIEAVKSKPKAVDSSSSSHKDKATDLEAMLHLSGDPLSNTDQPTGLLGLAQPPADRCSLMLVTPTLEETPAELSLVSPPASEPSEGAPDTASVASSSVAPEAETPATESGSAISSAADVEQEGKKLKQPLFCPTCKVTVNSASQLEAHNSGAKHKSMLEGQTVLPRQAKGKLLSRLGHRPKRIGIKSSLSIQNKAFRCQVCEIFVNSETQLKQHMSSRRHKDRLAGKLPRPRFSPYCKLQKTTALAVSILKSKLALQKHLTKTLAARFLPSPLTPATVCALTGPLTLRPAAATLFQAPLFGPALFRTPPGPVQAATGPFVFAPY